MARRAFTLVELLVIVAIIGIMTTAAILSVTSGQTAVRVKGATRDVFAAIRHARSTALVTQKPAIITYSNSSDGEDALAKIEITSATLFHTVDRSNLQTITGEPIKGLDDEAGIVEPKSTADETASGGDAAKPDSSGKEEGQTIAEILFAPISDEVLRGMRIKVQKGNELPATIGGEERAKSKLSVFSNVDYLLGRYKDAKAEAAKKEAEEKKKESEDASVSTSSDAPAEEGSEPVSIVWETNGRVEPHQVWVYPDGSRPEDGQLIRVDRFGGAKVVSGDGREDD